MLDMVLSVIREQSVFVLMGLMIAGGLISQFMASRRYRKLRGGIQSLAALQASPASASSSRTQAGALVRSERAQRRHEEQARQERKAQRQSEQEHKSEQGDEPAKTDVFSAERTAGQAPEEELPVKAETQGKAPQAEGAGEEEVDSQLLYLRQSLDLIAAGRDQKLEEEPRRRRKLSPAEEQIIVDILKEHLS